MSSRIGAGIGAFAVALIPVVLLIAWEFFFLVDFQSSMLTAIAAILILSIWAGSRLSAAGKSFVPVVLLVVFAFPIALSIEYMLIITHMTPVLEYGPLAATIGAVMLGVGILIARGSRRG